MGINHYGFETVETYLQRGVYYIPDYQREYSWIADEQVDDFWRDLDSAVTYKRDNHFFGQVVIHDNKIENKKYIIDGQQRTTTTVIFLAVLRELFKEIYKKYDYLNAQESYEDIRIKYIGRWSEENNRLRLTLGSIDKDFFKNNIQINRPSEDILAEKDSHKRIIKAFNYFQNKLTQKIEEESDYKEKYRILLNYYETFLKGFRLMYVETDDINEAFIIFETLNARGKDLETSDLLKNHLFRISGKSIDVVKKTWLETVENLDEIDITKFLRHYWNSKFSFTREKELYKKIQKYIDTPKKCEEFTQNFFAMSDVYKALINPNEFSYFSDSIIQKKLINLKITGASSFYPTVLSMVNSGYKENDILKIIKAIETLIFRNCVVAGKVANKYEILFGRIAYNISQKKFTDVQEIYDEISKDTLSEEEFETAFNTFSIKSVAVAKYVLRELNDFDSLEVKAISDNCKLNLEHIMPKSKGNWKVDEESHKKYINRLGNLTLLADEYNKSIQNKTFDVKKETYKKSKLQITNSICSFRDWNIDTIKQRQKDLFEKSKKIWSIT